MLHSCRIKFGSITNLTDARYAAAAYAEWVGFCFDESNPRYINPAKAKEIIDWLSGPTMVAELGHMLPGDFKEALLVLMIDTVQVTSLEAANAWHEAGFQVIWEGSNPPPFAIANVCLPEESLGATNEIIDFSNLSIETIKDRWLSPGPVAIQVTGDEESAAGIRDFNALDELLALYEL